MTAIALSKTKVIAVLKLNQQDNGDRTELLILLGFRKLTLTYGRSKTKDDINYKIGVLKIMIEKLKKIPFWRSH